MPTSSTQTHRIEIELSESGPVSGWTMSNANQKRDFDRENVKTSVKVYCGYPYKVCEGVCMDLSDSGFELRLSAVVPTFEE